MVGPVGHRASPGCASRSRSRPARHRSVDGKAPAAGDGGPPRRSSLARLAAQFAACAIANVIAMALPLALHRLGIDPAFGSGPLATVIQDLLSIVVYLGISTAILAPG